MTHRCGDDSSIVLQRPAGGARQLFLLLHGVGGRPADLESMGRVIGGAFPAAFIVSVQAPHAGDAGRGFQWFSVAGITDENRPGRVEAAMPAFLGMIAEWQREAGVDAQATALVGFSQGAIMALESTKAIPARAGRVVALAGRFATLPAQAAPEVTVHVFHGKEDPVVPYGHAIAGAERMLSLGTDMTADVMPFVGHEVPEEMARLVLERLTGYIPQRRWREALAADPGTGPQRSETPLT